VGNSHPDEAIRKDLKTKKGGTMSLDWRFTDDSVFSKLTEEEKKRNDLYIWGCLSVGIAQITEKTAKEWQFRYAFAVQLNGAYYSLDGKAIVPTLADVRKRIGLSTNVSTFSRTEFLKRHIRTFEENNARSAEASDEESKIEAELDAETANK
jgi:hypothetical protein